MLLEGGAASSTQYGASPPFRDAKVRDLGISGSSNVTRMLYPTVSR